MAVHDRVYRRLEGAAATSTQLPGRAIAHFGGKYSSRGWFAQAVFWASFIPTIVFTLGIYFASRNEEQLLRIMRQSAGIQVERFADIDAEAWRRLTSFILYQLIEAQAWFAMFLTAFVGAGLVADDLRSNALEVYMARPIRGIDYLLGKMGVLLRPLIQVTVVPLIFVFGMGCMFVEGLFGATWRVLPVALASALILALAHSLIVLGISSLSRSSRYATVIWFAFYTFSMGIQQILLQATGDARFDVVSYSENHRIITRELLDVPNLLGTMGVPMNDHAVAPSLVILGTMALLGALSVLRRTRVGRGA